MECSVCKPENLPESGSGKRTLEDVFHWISHNGSPMPAHRALPVGESSIDKHMIESQVAQHNHNMPESARPETQPAPSNGLFHLDYRQLEPQHNMPSISLFPSDWRIGRGLI
ncbi:hypothetical protein FH972_012598 [Carpinus fangiana]|uniref:Uncharacterized protein n=1 Tax=Carpinus fangiana TaxID=176857 RepID=A0A5N6R4H2_9ROSI|nr:hypothetical protein FH972_012598 [Carpinus fangiana]